MLWTLADLQAADLWSSEVARIITPSEDTSLPLAIYTCDAVETEAIRFTVFPADHPRQQTALDGRAW